MTTPVVLEEVIVAEPVILPYEDAARLLEQALLAGGDDPQVAYLLGLAYKRLGKVAEARAAFRKVVPADANIWLQLGLLSLQERQYAQAEQEFARSWEADPASFEACYNLALTRLALGQAESAAALVARAGELAPGPEDQRFLRVLGGLLRSCLPLGEPADLDAFPRLDPALAEMAAADEQRLLQLLRGLDQFDVVFPLLRTLTVVRPKSLAAQEAVHEAALVQGKRLADRCEWGAASRLLAPLARATTDGRGAGRATQAAYLNLLGCCACMEQDFDRGAKHFTAALRQAGGDPRLFHNLALAHEWQGQLEQAEPNWNHFLDLLALGVPGPPGRPDYPDNLAFEALNHLAEVCTKKERFSSALRYLQRASKVRPQDADLLERLFHLYAQLKRPEDARWVLHRLRQLRPHDPQTELYELELHETKSLEDIDRKLTAIGRILKKYPNDLRVEERAVGMVGEVIPLMGRLCDQLTEYIGRIVDQVRRLPHYQINWPAVHDEMRNLEDEFLKLRQITRLCLPLVTSDEHRRIIRELSAHIDRKIDDCRRMRR
jgi:Flp pilus assembly protein TadD